MDVHSVHHTFSNSYHIIYQVEQQAHHFSKEDITDVFLTHLHFDHCGGSIEKVDGKLVPAFANATYWSNADHWQWATEPNDREKASFLKENILQGFVTKLFYFPLFCCRLS